MLDLIFALTIFGLLMALGFGVGGYVERRHYANLEARERLTQRLSLVTIGAKTPIPEARQAQLFVGCVVVSSDYFRHMVATWSVLFGGEIPGFQRLLDRGRREAILRMKEAALVWGATQIANVRIETANLNDAVGDEGMALVEVIAYGTGIR
jgi:uncharacterized protein YbjQ (UPF0145 family)